MPQMSSKIAERLDGLYVVYAHKTEDGVDLEALELTRYLETDFGAYVDFKTQGKIGNPSWIIKVCDSLDEAARYIEEINAP